MGGKKTSVLGFFFLLSRWTGGEKVRLSDIFPDLARSKNIYLGPGHTCSLWTLEYLDLASLP